MKQSICTIAALISAGISLVLTMGFFVNQSSSGDWFEESGFLLNVVVSCLPLGLVLAARLRREPYWLASVMSIALAAPSLWLSAKFIKAVLSLAAHGDM